MLKRAKLIMLNYPNNPTAGVADLDFFKKLVAFAKKHDLLICHDLSYPEMTYEGYVAPSIFQVEGAKDVAIELHNLVQIIQHDRLENWFCNRQPNGSESPRVHQVELRH